MAHVMPRKGRGAAVAKRPPTKAQRAQADARAAMAQIHAQIANLEAALRCLKLAAKDLEKRTVEQAITEGANDPAQAQ